MKILKQNSPVRGDKGKNSKQAFHQYWTYDLCVSICLKTYVIDYKVDFLPLKLQKIDLNA